MNNRCDPEDHEEVMGGNHHNEGDPLPEGTFSTLSFLIQQPEGIAPMKNISPSMFPRFYGKAAEDLDKFLFEFDIYDYTTYAQNLKLFPATLKDNALHWFMSLGGGTVTT